MRRPRILAFLAFCAFSGAARAQQIGSLISPGKLSRAHAMLEGIANCEKCHEPGRRVTAAKCLACHRPIAQRIAAHQGVHRDVKEECVSCHIEHAGRDAAITPAEWKSKFDHAREAGFPLQGRHSSIACAQCHRVPSFLAARPVCASCHTDAHHGALGADCVKCHSPDVPFKETARRFDHSKTAYPLTGAHAALACGKCHATGTFKILRFSACADCHRDPHRTALGACETCHTTASFHTTRIDHAKTGFPLRGRHAQIACASCHVQSPLKAKLAASRCADCHRDPHAGLFKGDCAHCHNETSFRNAPFDHTGKTGFALDGRHASLPCSSCHRRAGTGPKAGEEPRVVDFRGARRECASCHRDPHGGELGQACQACHSTQTFRVTAFRHPRNPEFFTGAHASVACAKCHGPAGAAPGARKFKGLSFACATCHRDVHLGQVGGQCEACHSVEGPKFAPDRFSHSRSRFPLTGVHPNLPCSKCHPTETAPFPAGRGTAVRLKGIPLDCQGCHKDPHLEQLGSNCAGCHTTSTFTVARYVHRHPPTPTFFSGKHGSAPCAACHKKEAGAFPAGHGIAVRFVGLTGTCSSCHADPHRGLLGPRCETCHNVSRWNDASRAFHKIGVFPLDGKHLLVPCASCHLKGVIKGTPTRCYDCHWIRRQDDLYRTRLGNECEQCHTTSSWALVRWDHAAQTGFALSGPHRSLPCEACHKNQSFTAASADCYSCHKADYQQANNPSHVAAGFPTACETCHKASDASWSQGVFSHTAFPLVGVHATQPCAACHRNNVFTGTPTDCYSCHKTDYQRAADPNHAAAGFPTACETCHKASDATWQLGSFNHSFYPLVGVHAAQACNACHKNNVFQGTPTDCFSCHATEYQSASNPNHIAAGFFTTCQTCHKASDASWQQGVFSHSFFPLLGVHATQACNACHANNVFKGTPTDCYSCHKVDFQGATNPNHVTAGFPTTCDTCHKASDATWQLGSFDHSFFPLLGVHATQPCAACHANNVFKGTPTDCYSCHKTDYQNATNPNHVAAGFPTTCATCHKASDASWQQGVFSHSFFPLLGVHATQPCAACHKNNLFAGTPTDCYSCHKTDYQNATNPNHVAAGFPTTCTTCHKASDASWQQGVFSHSFFPLLGVHATQPCAACHKNNVFAGTPTDCYSCHRTDYQNTTNPNHAAAGFPTTCQSCHKFSDASWNLAVFNHAWFPITSGPHAGNPCSACHTSPTNFAVFTCLTCHDRASTDSHHTDVAGYSYNSQACYSCHPQGQAGD